MVFLQYLYYVLSISSRSLFLMMMMMNLVFAGPTGLSLKLIHRDSPESPLYTENLTQLERMERDIQQSIDRKQQLTSWMKSSWVSRNNSTNGKSDLDTVRPEVSSPAIGVYMAQIGIGTFANGDPIFYYLFLDTGSDLLWIQCKGNNDSRGYFRQDAPLFDWQTSLTFQALPASSPHPFCRKYGNLNAGGFCGYRVGYVDGSRSMGFLATEKLTVKADNGGLEGIDNFVFGCGLSQYVVGFGTSAQEKNPIAGILGLGGGEDSFIIQLGDRVDKKFEYCLKPLYDDHADTPTFLRFGSDTKIVVGGQGVQTTSIVPAVRAFTIYYAIMAGISVGGVPVVYPEGSNVFGTRPDGTGGCVFDSGCSVTQLSTPVYDPLRNHLIDFFYDTYKIRSYDKPPSPFDLCFERPNGFNQFPTITFHYTGANFDIEPKAAFKIGSKVFCLVMFRSSGNNHLSVILGARQQVNHRILHDVGRMEISWANENCSDDI